jgi:hypothetical protein
LTASVRRDLRSIGIVLRVKDAYWPIAWSRVEDPREKVPLALFPAWSKDFLNASNFIEPLFAHASIGSLNYSLVGATPAQLRAWGYDVSAVPGIDPKIDECLALVGDVQVRCWAEADQLLMEEVVPSVPYVVENKIVLASDRVVAYSFCQFTILPALDRIAVADA